MLLKVRSRDGPAEFMHSLVPRVVISPVFFVPGCGASRRWPAWGMACSVSLGCRGFQASRQSS